MSEETPKLSKKQLKALRFKAKKSDKAAEKLEKVETSIKEVKEKKESEKRKNETADGVHPRKKRKTRRGHHGRGKNGAHNGPRFLLFVGNLPYSIDEKTLREHFKAGNPDLIRIRKDKGIAFLEFLTAKGHIQGRIDACLALHHSVLNNRRINVELTAGGGGNSKNRIEKIKEKNEKLIKKRVEKIKKEKKSKESSDTADSSTPDETDLALKSGSGIHPSRLAMIEKSKN